MTTPFHPISRFHTSTNMTAEEIHQLGLEEVGGPKDKSRTKSVEDGGGLWDPEMTSCRNHTVLGTLRARTCVTSYDPDDFWTVDVLVYIAQMSFAVEVLSRALGETMRGLMFYQCDHSINQI